MYDTRDGHILNKHVVIKSNEITEVKRKSDDWWPLVHSASVDLNDRYTKSFLAGNKLKSSVYILLSCNDEKKKKKKPHIYQEYIN